MARYERRNAQQAQTQSGIHIGYLQLAETSCCQKIGGRELFTPPRGENGEVRLPHAGAAMT